MPWPLLYRSMPKEETTLSFTRTYCPPSGQQSSSTVSKASVSELTLKLTGSPERTGNSAGKIKVQMSDYEAELKAGKMVRGQLGQGVVYHYFDISEKPSEPVHLRANAYFPSREAALDGLNVYISKDTCPDLSHYLPSSPRQDSCEVAVTYNQDLTTF